MTTWNEAGRPPLGNRPDEDDVVTTQPDGRSVARYSDEVPLEGSTGDVDGLVQYAGQSVGFAAIQPANEIVTQLGYETVDAIAHPAGMLSALD